MRRQRLRIALRCTIALVWLGNGLFAKVLGFIPRHEQIVARILGPEYAHPLTVAIGLAEVVMFVWVLSAWRSRLNAVSQMIIVAVMNILETVVVPDLLLWGRLNIVFAGGFVAVVYLYEFRVRRDVGEN